MPQPTCARARVVEAARQAQARRAGGGEIERRLDRVAGVIAEPVVAHDHLAVARAAHDLELLVDAERVVVHERVIELVRERLVADAVVRGREVALGRERGSSSSARS